MDQEVNEIRLSQWTRIIQEANASGLSKSKWCRQHDVPERVFYYWQRKIRLQAISQIKEQSHETSGAIAVQSAGFVELKPPVTNPSDVNEVTYSHSPEITCEPATDPAPDLTLSFGAYALQIRNSVSERTLKMVMKVLRDA